MTIGLVLVRLGAALLLFRLLGLPLARLAFPGLRATSYALATPLALVLGTHATWLLCHAGLELGWRSIGLGLALVAGAAGLAWRALGERGIGLAPRWRDLASHHLAFALAFTLAVLITARNPAVDSDSERPMDYAMVSAVLASRSLPLEDPWLAGERVSYYDYGYFATAYLACFAGPLALFFPLAVALTHATLLVGVLAIGLDLAGLAGGLLAAWFVSAAGNLDGLLQTVRRGLAVPLDWFHGARILSGGIITEFPFFALLWGDLHPYALALPLWPLLVATAATVARGEAQAATSAVGAVAYAALVATHTWDAVPVATILLLGALLVRAPEPGAIRRALVQVGLVLATGALLALPYLSHLPTGGRGLAWVATRSTLGELGTMWGAFAAILLAALLAALARERLVARWGAPLLLVVGLAFVATPTIGLSALWAAAALSLALAWLRGGVEGFAWAMASTGFGLIGGVELLYLDDWYVGELERMNTVFKAYVEAWVLLGLATALVAPAFVCAARAWPGRLARTVLVLLAVAASAVYPLRAIPARSGSLRQPRPLDAWDTFRQTWPDDAEAAARLRGLPRGVVLEASGDPYTWAGRFATFTGYPCVVGWGHHEAGWRNSWDGIRERMADVQAIYQGPSLEAALPLLRRWQVRYLVVGGLERQMHPPEGLAKFETLTPVVRAGMTTIYQVP